MTLQLVSPKSSNKSRKKRMCSRVILKQSLRWPTLIQLDS